MQCIKSIWVPNCFSFGYVAQIRHWEIEIGQALKIKYADTFINYPSSSTHEVAHICGFYKVWPFDFLMVSFLVNLSHDIIMQSLLKRYESKVFCGILYVWL